MTTCPGPQRPGQSSSRIQPPRIASSLPWRRSHGGNQYAGVPQGPYSLRTGSNDILTDARHVEPDSDEIGRWR
ncbi:hypothetical protein HPC49_19390 [Pyxidicoccus fallax]|uniref:Uncharacterized protein n=1 Tax=Pyxidicoccus fallax TaxID=394095 RepID=A0A848LD96_9BACT|nr:hypothetical protein [Pyxidicoccus fallax]NMO14231.1 hypothetical protein [Pyxidicoccus fallax]NPC80377.1 hypothetical protein [Pyxidicoccus fallax]